MLKRRRRGRPTVQQKNKQQDSTKVSLTQSRSLRQNSRWTKCKFCFKILLKRPDSDKCLSPKWRKIKLLISKAISLWTTWLFNPQMETVAIKWLTFTVSIGLWMHILSISSRIQTWKTLTDDLSYLLKKLNS